MPAHETATSASPNEVSAARPLLFLADGLYTPPLKRTKLRSDRQTATKFDSQFS